MRKEKRNHLRRLLACLLVAVMMLTAIYPTFAAETAEGDVSPAAEVQTDVAENAADATPVMDGDLDAQEIAETATTADDAIPTDPAAVEPVEAAETDADEAAAPADGEMDANVTNDTANQADTAGEADAAAAEDANVAVTPETVVFTKAGPFLPPVSVSAKKLMKALPLRAKSSDAPDGLEMSKKATPNADGSYTVELETYTTGNVVSHTTSVPVDIVLVLDQSGSMQDSFGSTTRQSAMKNAVNNFVSNVHDKYSESADHRIAIVTFGSNATDLVGWTTVDDSGYATLSSAVTGLPQDPTGATNAGAAMGRAQRLVTTEYSYTGSNTERQKVVIVFTDGVPTTGTAFNVGVANGALNAAQNIKDAGATVYSVGIFTGANPSELYGSSGFSRNSDGTVGSDWSDFSFWNIGDIRHYDVPAGNRFLNYLSNNFNNVRNIGLREYSRTIFGIGYRGWQITANYSRSSSNYYLTANDADSLDNVFQSISEQISTPTISLGTETVVKDIVSPQFKVPEGASVKFYTQPYQGNNAWGAKTTATGVHLVADTPDDNVSVTGFDFDANCVTEDAKQDGSHGSKLIIEITITPDPNYLGGSETATNGGESGVVDSTGNTIAHFDVPTVNLPLKKIEPQLADKNIYLTTEDQLSELFNKADQKFTVSNQDGSNSHEVNFATLFNGVNNANVEVTFQIMDGDDVVESFVIPAGGTSGAWHSGDMPILSKDKYTIQCVITDKDDSSNKTVGTETANINVFKPELTYADKNVYYQGEQVDLANVTPTKVEWKHGATLDTAVTMDTTKPTLTYTYGGVSGTRVDQTTDYTVQVTAVGVQGHTYDDINLVDQNAVTFLRDCTVEELSGEPASANEAFLIHVYLPTVAFADTEAYYGDTVTLPDYNTSATWTDANGTVAPATMDNTEPALTVNATPDSSKINDKGYVLVKEDIPVKAVVKIGDTDVTQALIDAGRLTRTCDTDSSHTAVTTDQAFVVHVKTVSLTVTKAIEGAFANKSGTFNFTVTVTPAADSGLSAVTKTFSLGDGESETLTELPKGDFKVEETDVPADYVVTFKVNGEAADSANNATSGTLSADETKVVVSNTLDNIPITGIADGSHTMIIYLVSAAAVCLMMMLVVSAKKRNSYHGKRSGR